MTTIRITATEVIIYQNDYDLTDLLDYLNNGLPEDEQVSYADFDHDVDRLVEAVHRKAHTAEEGGRFAEDLERHGDVQGQEWAAEVVVDE